MPGIMRPCATSLVAALMLLAPTVSALELDQPEPNSRCAPQADDPAPGPQPEDPADDDEPASSTEISPSLGLAPRADSFESLERGLRTPVESRTSHRVNTWYLWYVRTHHPRRRLERIQRQVRCDSMTLRVVATSVQSHAPPAAFPVLP